MDTQVPRSIRLSIAALATSLCLAACEREPPRRAPSLASRLELAAGNVEVMPPGGSFAAAVSGLVLREGSTVRVGPGDRALLRLDDGSGVFLRHGTTATLGRDGLALDVGEAWIDAPARDRAPARYVAGAVVIAASDAGLDVRRRGASVEIYVARGLAVVTAPGGRSEVKEGERAAVAAGRVTVSPMAFWEDWTGGMADRRLTAGQGGAGTGRIYAVDRRRPGAAPLELEIRAQTVRAVIRDGVARTTVDQRFFNAAGHEVEGYYWFTIPEGAAIDRFALETNGKLIDGEMVERKQAAAAYEAAISSSLEPALLEWIDGRTFRARIYPIPATAERRVVLSYLELLPTMDRRTQYVYPLGSGGVRIEELALEVDLDAAGEQLKLATTAEARIEAGGRKVTLRRSGYTPRGDFLLEMIGGDAAPLRAVRVQSTRGQADYVMVRYTPDLSWAPAGPAKRTAQVVVVVDTSASGDQSERQLRADVAEAILRGLSTGDRFALVTADLRPRVIYPATGLAPADEASIGRALERLSEVRSGGASDLGAVFDVALRRLHGASQGAVVYVGDGLPTVGELDGSGLAARLVRALAGSSARLFALGVGADADHGLLGRLAELGGGQASRVDLGQQVVQEALRVVGQIKTPTLTELKVDLGAGLDQSFSSVAGNVSRGQEVTILARTHHPLPTTVQISGKLDGVPFVRQHPLVVQRGAAHTYVPGLWARRTLGQLLAERDKNRGGIIRLGLDYGLMTPFTSFLVLESDDAYRQQGIERRARDPLWGAAPRAVLEGLAAAPLALFGCSKPKEEPLALDLFQSENRKVRYLIRPPEHRADQVPQWLSRRQPGQEGKMGSRKGKRAPHRPPEEAARGDEALGGIFGRGGEAFGMGGFGARTRAEAARSSGVLGLLGAAASKRPADPRAVSAPELHTCSDASRRALAQRRAIWVQRLDELSSPQAYLALYQRARRQCELRSWSDRKELLDLIQQRVTSAADARIVLGGLDGPAAELVRRRLLRRASSPALAAVFERLESDVASIDWSLVEAVLASAREPERRLTALRALCVRNPRSAECVLRLARALVETGHQTEALRVVQRSLDDGLVTPALMRQAGELLAAAGRTLDAQRAYSEIVEFAPRDAAARQLLGDIFLRHGWHEEAYRQYATLCDLRPNDPLALLRLAAAAAGSGRTDEALRLERRVSSAEGDVGSADPRRWARLASSARLAQLVLSAPRGEGIRQSLERSLRRLQVVPVAGSLLLLTWEDLEARLALTVEQRGRRVAAPGVDGAATGLVALTIGPRPLALLGATVQRIGGTTRDVRFTLTAISTSGGQLSISRHRGQLAADALPLALSSALASL